MNNYLTNVYQKLATKFSQEKEYLNVVKEFLNSIDFYVANNEEIISSNIIERLINPDRIISFKVSWVDATNNVQVNTGWRVQHNNLLGPYKGGIRFDKTVNESILKFLAFEQTLKNSLTNLPLGGAKGGADFDPKGKTDLEIMRFCQAYMTELYKYIGPYKDVPAGDLGVGKKEVGYLFNAYKKLTNEHSGSFTSKDVSIGGSLGRFEATGYGLVYFTSNALKSFYNTTFENKDVIISGTGNVGYNTMVKVKELKGNIIAVSNIDGVIYDKNGIDLDLIKTLFSTNQPIKNYLKFHKDAAFNQNPKTLWKIKADIAMPCATQNEIDLESAKNIVDNNFLLIAEGSNKPLTPEAFNYLISKNFLTLPSKAANAGGVIVSAFEMTQNATFSKWDFSTVELKLQETMETIFNTIHNEALKLNEPKNLTKAANLVSFKKLATAMKYDII